MKEKCPFYANGKCTSDECEHMYYYYEHKQCKIGGVLKNMTKGMTNATPVLEGKDADNFLKKMRETEKRKPNKKELELCKKIYEEHLPNKKR